MNMSEALSELNKAIATSQKPKVVKMTKVQFGEHVTSELQKAKADAEDEDKAKGATAAKKRLEFLRGTVSLLAKAESWTGAADGVAAIPVYENGFEPPTELPTLAEVSIPPAISGTGGDGQSVFSNALPSYDQPSVTPSSNGTNVPASGVGTQADDSIFAGGPVAKSLGDLTEALKGLGFGTTPTAQAAAPQAPAAGLDDPAVWPRDLATKDFLQAGEVKKAEEWGVDPWAPTK